MSYTLQPALPIAGNAFLRIRPVEAILPPEAPRFLSSIFSSMDPFRRF